MLHGLTQLNVELTSRCDKHTLCAFCGHQDPAVFPSLKFGDVDSDILWGLSSQLEHLGKSLVVQFHRDGDPLATTHNLRFVCQAFRAHIRSFVTHGERLGERAKELIGSCDSVCVSIFRGDPDRDLQLASLRSFLDQKGDRLPRVSVKVVGDLSDEELIPFTALSLPILRRKIHLPIGNSKYAGGLPPLPEHGICLDLLHHPSIAWDGRVYLCNRLDTNDTGLIGNLNEDSLDEIWNGTLRADYLQKHLEGRRAEVPPCTDCLYYGVPG